MRINLLVQIISVSQETPLTRTRQDEWSDRCELSWFRKEHTAVTCDIKDMSKASSTRIQIFSNPQLFLSGYGYRPQVSGEFDSESGQKINPLSRAEKNTSATNPITCGRVNLDIFLFDDVKSVSSLSPNNKSIWRYNVVGEQSKFPVTILLYGKCSEDISVKRSLGY